MIVNNREVVEFDLDSESNVADGVRKVAHWIRTNPDKQTSHHIVIKRLLEGEIHFLQKDNFLTQLSDSIPVEWENNVSLIMADVNLKENLDIWFKGTSRKKAIVNGVPTPFSLLQRTVNYLQDKNVPLPKLVQNKNRKFICLNGAAKPHRARLVGDLYNKGYQNDGWISWVNRYGKLNHKKHFPHPDFKGEDIILDFDQEQIDTGVNQEILPHQYPYAGFEIVNESITSDTSIFITEKTWKPVLYEKVFIPHGPRNMIKFMMDHGFQPYTELYDIEFDSLPYEERYTSMWKQIDKLMEMSTQDWENVYKHNIIIKSKLKHNAQVFRNIQPSSWQSQLDAR